MRLAKGSKMKCEICDENESSSDYYGVMVCNQCEGQLIINIINKDRRTVNWKALGIVIGIPMWIVLSHIMTPYSWIGCRKECNMSQVGHDITETILFLLIQVLVAFIFFGIWMIFMSTFNEIFPIRRDQDEA